MKRVVFCNMLKSNNKSTAGGDPLILRIRGKAGQAFPSYERHSSRRNETGEGGTSGEVMAGIGSAGRSPRDFKISPPNAGYKAHAVNETTRAASAVQVGGKLIDLAERLRRLAPSVRDPERYHVEKSEIEAGLRRLAREFR